MSDSDGGRLSVSLLESGEGREDDLCAVWREFETLFVRKGYGHVELIRDEGRGSRFYAVHYWTDKAAVRRFGIDKEARVALRKLFRTARATPLLTGVRPGDSLRLGAGGDPPGPRLRGGAKGAGRLIAAARRARKHAHATFSSFKVGAALEVDGGIIVSGCNIENATFGLTICAERVAMFKALSEGHRSFARMAIVSDTDTATPPCGACRQVLWEFGGDLEITLASLRTTHATYRLSELLPLPFDTRLLRFGKDED